MNPLTVIAFSFIAAFSSLAVVPRRRGVYACSVLAVLFSFCIMLAPSVLGGRCVYFERTITSWFSLSFVADGLSVFMAVVSSLVALLIGVYSLEYMRHEERSEDFYFWMLLFVSSMMGLVFSANLILIYCFWEITAVCSWRLIGFHRHEKDTKAADKAFLVTFFGASLMLAGIALVYINFGTLQLNMLKDRQIPDFIAFLLLAGILSKSAQLPLQSWLPDAGVAPTPVTALLHAAVLVKIGVYAFARIFSLTFIPGTLFLDTVVFLSVATIIVAAGSALVETNIKRILAYSTISQLGYIMLALSLGGSFALKLAMLYILAHSLAKAGLFLCAGIIEHKAKTKDINELGGLMKAMPYTGAAYLLCAFSIIGLPPLLGFWPKFMVVLLCVKSGYTAAAVFAIIGALFTLFYLMRLFDKVFLGQEKIKVSEEKRSYMVEVVMVLGVLSLMLGILIKVPFGFISKLIS